MTPWLTTTDMMGREMILHAPPTRIVSLVPSQTELLYDLGLNEEVIGITKFCVHPESWFRSKERIGGTKQLHIDRIAALKPDLILANKEENEKSDIESLAQIAPVWISDIAGLSDALRMIRGVAQICNKSSRGADIALEIEREFATLELQANSKRVAYAIWKDPWMWAAGDTFISDMIARMGWQNLLSEKSRYPALDLPAMAAFNPEIILLSSEPYPFGEKHMPAVKAAFPDAKILLVDGEMFSWYGSRLLQSPAYFKKLIDSI